LAWCLIGIPNLERGWTKLIRLLGPYFAVWCVYVFYEVMIQLSGQYVQQGLFSLGPHLLTNWQFFQNLVIPNPVSEPVRNFLLRNFPTWVLSLANLMAVVIRLALLLAGALTWWKGPKSARLWIAFSVIAYLPFLGWADGIAGSSRYFYLPAVGFSAFVAEVLRWTRDYLLRGKRTVLATMVPLVALFSFLAASLVVSRIWQQQMVANSEVRRQVLTTVGDYLDAADRTVSTVCLADFPDKFEDLHHALRLFYGIRPTWTESAALDGGDASCDTLIITYSNGQLSARES
jgi:hypothetical protein